MAFPSLPPSPSSSAATWRRRSGLVALLLLLIFLSFQVVVHVPSVRSAVSRRLFSDHRHRAAREAGHRSCPGCGDLQDVEDFNKTIAYTDQDGRIKLFKVTAKEFASSSIWENPLLPRDSQPLAELKESAEEQPLAIGSEANNLSSSAVSATQRPDPIKLKREVFRRRRKEQRIQELLQMDKEAELQMRNLATNSSRNFDNKVKVSYNIWRQEFHHTNTDSTVKLMKDQIIMAKVYATIARSQNEPDLYASLMKCIKESKAAIGDAHMDSELDSSALERAKAMGHVLSSARDVLYNSDEVSRRLRVMLQSAELNIDTVKKQNTFLVQHAAKTVPMPLHCLHMQLITDYHLRDGVIKEYFQAAALKDEEDKAKLEDRSLYHYAIFSDNVLAASVVVRSTVTNAKEPNKHVFHIVTDKLNFAAMKMWFISHSPLPATVHVENIDNFKWLNSSYCLVMRQLESARLKEFYFKAHDPSSLSDGNENLKYRNPKYLSMLNHLRFYMPEIHPKLDKILFLDDDVVVQKDLTPLWDVDLKGMVNGAVETCKESFHRFDTYLNFSHPKISENFDPRACGWAFGMNMFDLKEWKKRNITGIYHYWQNLNEDRKLWKLGTLPPGLITFYNLTHPLDHTWHVLGLGYDPAVDIAEIENAAVVHYNGNYKPWLDLAISKYKAYWSKYVDVDSSHIRHCYASKQ
ncbi:putative galacturonosyltransferase 3 [Hordeum vulgare]|uniref:Hexosyltransferase n=1 Tax=Hordeum vulgare subsp. vulgare TaxID=112509 RepID=A0A8I7BK84_HORVV|nr:probable galacturonosyltransferase 3 [Hordeum vulgare subsp. vulgare]KAE8796021.1 putative galacturonosyltransferase 3 [Hordeum vulgare]